MATRITFESFSMKKLIGEGYRGVPPRYADHATAAICQQGRGGGSQFVNSDMVSSVSVSDACAGLVIANAVTGAGTGRSAEDDWRVAVHEGGHVLIHRFFSNEVSATIVPDAEYSGKVWWPEGVDAAAIADVGRDGEIRCVFSIVQQGVIAMMGGCAAEMALLGHAPPKYIGSDVPNASSIASMVCRTTPSVVAFLEHGYQEALAIVESNKTVVQAIAQALIDHPKHTLDNAEIDAVIAPALAAKAAADEHKRRADWRSVEKNAASFTAKNGMI
jgi:hypothetical protein